MIGLLKCLFERVRIGIHFFVGRPSLIARTSHSFRAMMHLLLMVGMGMLLWLMGLLVVGVLL